MFSDLTKFYRNHPINVMIAALLMAASWTYKSFDAVTTGDHGWLSYAIVAAAVGFDIFALRNAWRVKARVDAREPLRRVRAIIRSAVRQRRAASASAL